MNIKWILIYGGSDNIPLHLEAARVAVLKTLPLVATQCGIMVLDRLGIEAEAMRTCVTWGLKLLVVGTNARPASAISRKYYERAVLPKGTAQETKARLTRYALRKASGVVIIGDSPDCQALRMYAALLRKTAKHVPAPLDTTRLVAPDSDWLRINGHWYING